MNDEHVLIEILLYLFKKQKRLILFKEIELNQILYCKELMIEAIEHQFLFSYYFYQEDYIDHPELYLISKNQSSDHLHDVFDFIQYNGEFSHTDFIQLLQNNYPKYMRQYRQQKK